MKHCYFVVYWTTIEQVYLEIAIRKSRHTILDYSFTRYRHAFHIVFPSANVTCYLHRKTVSLISFCRYTRRSQWRARKKGIADTRLSSLKHSFARVTGGTWKSSLHQAYNRTDWRRSGTDNPIKSYVAACIEVSVQRKCSEIQRRSYSSIHFPRLKIVARETGTASFLLGVWTLVLHGGTAIYFFFYSLAGLFAFGGETGGFTLTSSYYFTTVERNREI